MMVVWTVLNIIFVKCVQPILSWLQLHRRLGDHDWTTAININCSLLNVIFILQVIYQYDTKLTCLNKNNISFI